MACHARGQSGLILLPPGEIVKTLFPDREASDAPVMPPEGPPITVIWPPVLNVCFCANTSVIESFVAVFKKSRTS